MPKPTALFLLFCALASLGACVTAPHQQAFYVSPFNGNSEGYHTLPMHTDTTRTAVYARISGYGGKANDLNTDHFGGANASFYVARHGSWWQSYYGLDGTLGSYGLGTWQVRDPGTFNFILYNGPPAPPPPTAGQLNTYTGGYTYGGLGVSGGVNGVIPMGQGEWRVLGIETAVHRELGDYWRLRRNLPDSVASYIVRNAFFGTAGLTTEWIFRTSTGDFGFRLAGGWTLGNNYQHPGVYDSLNESRLHYGGYGSFIAHYTLGRYTLYYLSERAAKGWSLQAGVIFRFDHPRLPAKKRIYHERPPLPPRPRLPFGL